MSDYPLERAARNALTYATVLREELGKISRFLRKHYDEKEYVEAIEHNAGQVLGLESDLRALVDTLESLGETRTKS